MFLQVSLNDIFPTDMSTEQCFGSGTSFCRAIAPKAWLLISPYLPAIMKSVSWKESLFQFGRKNSWCWEPPPWLGKLLETEENEVVIVPPEIFLGMPFKEEEEMQD